MTPRDITFSLLRRWTNPGDPPFLPERSDDTFAGLSPRDRAFAFDLLTGIIRWRGCLDAVLASRLRQGLDSLEHPVRAVLWLGAYQLLFQRGTSDYAAVDTTVDLARKHRDTAKAGGLVNAVLRGITRLTPTVGPRSDPTLSRRCIALDFQTQLGLSEDIFCDPRSNPIGHLAAVRSHPAPLVEHLRNIHGQQLAGELLLRNNIRPIITLRADADSLDVPAAAGLVAHAHAPRFLVAAQGWNPHIEELVRKGMLSPQDPTAALPVRALAELLAGDRRKSPATMLDLCAGLGTKSVQLARAFPDAQVTAADIDSVKLARLIARATQLGQKNLQAVPLSQIENRKSKIENLFDVVLVDVPCSNTGVMGKRVQSRWRWPALDRAALRQSQVKLLTQGSSLLAPGGKLVYSTCSIDPAENDQLVKFFCESAGNSLHVLREQATLPCQSSGATETHDGGYFVILGTS